MVSIRGWIILHAFHLPVFSTCVVVDLVTGLSAVIFVDAPRAVGLPREELGESILLGGVVLVTPIIAAIARPMRCRQRTSNAVSRWISRFALAQSGPKCTFVSQSCTTDHFAPFSRPILVHSARFAVIAVQCPCQQKGCPRVEGTPRNTPLSLPMASGLFTGRSRRSARPGDQSSPHGHWTRRS